ncbi:hypothetical protein ELI13_10315 [Rhizobium ruizarguesonis]|jgi:hypothetical protein|uniref:Lipoprotein n=2 Tax=Rhizobium TaxID=379 RepID=A0AAE4YM43_9HYPH|nr:hypothetical protein [Rhizobium ruizarguesonis]MBY5807172.1 hypothetical protein [Rhizobium leguminosarum]NKL17259.1 hypothetical protein [Rhizobium leguminosarum bv. viciae]QIO43512.1 hypothetical protein HA464_05505 [Rhizobium leguminosarum bv. trifolii]MBY5847390.1 hypothetical protein [Rhizobium leguminosarum]MBY5854384.1 hypothetical protein [Rhizobium leguminosarum]
MKPSLFVVGLPLLVGSCASTLPPDVVASPAAVEQPSARPAAYRSPISGYVTRQPVDPKPWRRQNDLQSPANGDAS